MPSSPITSSLWNQNELKSHEPPPVRYWNEATATNNSNAGGTSGSVIANPIDNGNRRDINEDTYDVGIIANGMRELELRLESELEEHEKMWSAPDETASHN